MTTPHSDPRTKRIRARRTNTSIVAFLALIAAACSGGSGGADDVGTATLPTAETEAEAEAEDAEQVTAETESAPEPDTESAETDPSLPLLASVGRNVAEHGDAGAFAVTMIALDRGYSVEQIAAGDVIAVDGSIGTEQPAGSARGFLVSGPQGLMRRQADVRLPEELDLRVEFLGSTLNEIHGATWNRHEEAVKQAAAEFNEEFTPDHVRLSWAVVQLVSRGYTPEQAIEGLVFGEVTLDSPVCGRLPEPPEGPPTSLDGCPPITDPTPSTTAPSSGGEQAAPDPPPADPVGEIGFEPGTFTGSAIGLLGDDIGSSEDETILLTDSASVEVGAESLSGTIELLVQATSAGDGDEGDLDDIVDDTICVSFVLVLDGVALSDPDIGQFSGSAVLDGNFEFGNCPPGGLPSFQTITVSVVADVDGDVLTLTLSADGDTIDITLNRQG